MKILFIGHEPSDSLAKILLSSGFSIRETKRIPALDKKWSPDLVSFAPKTPAHTNDLIEIKDLFPKAWLALVIDKKWLNDNDIYHQLLENDLKNEVWLLDQWELTFWLSLQNFARYQKMINEADGLKIEKRSLKRQGDELTRHSKLLIHQLEQDVNLASNIQRSLLPKFYPEIPGVSVYVKYLPAAGVGGDYYDIFEFGDKKRFGILIADSKTHGMAAALLSVLVKVRLEEMKDRFPDSKSFMEFLNKEISTVNKDKAPLSLLYGILDRSSLSFQYTVAGHLKPLLWRNGAPTPMPVTPSPPLGNTDHFDFKETTIGLKPGDLMFFFTDGLDAVLNQSKNGTQEKLASILQKKGKQPDPLEVQNEMMALIDRFKTTQPLPDDLTLIHFSIHERTLYLAADSNK